MAASFVALAAEGLEFNPFEFATGATLWTWIIFLVALPLMWKLVFGPITKALYDRDLKVEESIRAADDARRRTEEQMARSRVELDAALAEAKRVRAEADEQAERFRVEATSKARAEAESLLQKAREEIHGEKRRALAELRQLTVDLAISAATKVLRKDLDQETNRRLVEDFLRTLPEERRN